MSLYFLSYLLFLWHPHWQILYRSFRLATHWYIPHFKKWPQVMPYLPGISNQPLITLLIIIRWPLTFRQFSILSKCLLKRFPAKLLLQLNIHRQTKKRFRFPIVKIFTMIVIIFPVFGDCSLIAPLVVLWRYSAKPYHIHTA